MKIDASESEAIIRDLPPSPRRELLASQMSGNAFTFEATLSSLANLSAAMPGRDYQQQ